MAKNTYVSLFSSAGVSCYGFLQEGFDCVASNELMESRLAIQQFNHKCRYSTGYIVGNISNEETKQLLLKEINHYKSLEKITDVDVVIATPPGQEISIANYNQSNNEIIHNSLVVESIKIIKEIYPKFFIVANVSAFFKTVCGDSTQEVQAIDEVISQHLGCNYSFASKTINFKDYCAISCGTSSVFIGVRRDLADEVSPFELFPDMESEKEISFNLEDESKKFHQYQIIESKLSINQQNNSKYSRWAQNKVASCIHMQNDQFASQNTMYLQDVRAFSIRELMHLMTVPDSFRWTLRTDLELNSLEYSEKRAFLKQEVIKIRQVLIEAVPTTIFNRVAWKIKTFLSKKVLSKREIQALLYKYDNDVFCSCNLKEPAILLSFVQNQAENISLSSLSRLAELANSNRSDNAAFYTDRSLITEVVKALPDCTKQKISILEPAAGIGNFLPALIKRFEGKEIEIDLVDIDQHSLNIAKALIEKHFNIPCSCKIKYIHGDFLTLSFDRKYDYVVGNPPFYKMKTKDDLFQIYKEHAINKETNNICSFFLDKSMHLANNIALVLPKSVIYAPEFKSTREYLAQKQILSIIDFGEQGFDEVLIETVAIVVSNNLDKSSRKKEHFVKVKSFTNNYCLLQKQNYICDEVFPYWIIYRNYLFDEVSSKLEFGCFNVFRDRQITNSILNSSHQANIRVLKSRNISDDGSYILNIEDYDAYIDEDQASKLSVFDFLNRDDVYLTPNMTYRPRVIKKPKGCLVNGSLAILIPKNDLTLTPKQCLYFSTDEYRTFYQIARNFQTRSLNVDANSVYFYGVLQD